MKWRAGLFPKYFLIIALLVGGSLIASGAINLYFSYQETRASLVNLQREKALTAAVRIAQFARDIESQLRWTTLPVASDNRGIADQRRLDFHRLLRLVPAITEVSYLDDRGREQLKLSRLAMDSEGSNTDYSGEPRFLQARKGRTWFGPVYFRKETEPYLTVAIAEAGDRRGVTVVEVNLKFIWDVISTLRVGSGGLAYVVDGKGFLVAHPDISQVLRKVNLAELPQVKSALAATAGAEWQAAPDARDAGGTPVLAADAPIEALNWHVFVEAPRSAVFAPLYGAISRTALLLFAGVLVSLLASAVLVRRMVDPIRALQRGAARIGSGDLEGHIAVHTGDELEALARQFNEMAARLRESYAGLELKVEQRTAELSEALERQTAIAEILQVITGLPNQVEPVLAAVVERSAKLCDSAHASIRFLEGNGLRLVASYGNMPSAGEILPAGRDTAAGRAAIDKVPVRVVDMQAEAAEFPKGAGFAGDIGFHSVLCVPLLHESEVIGVIGLQRRDVHPFSEGQVALLRTFANQAAIAIQNARLFQQIQEKSRELEIANKHKSEFLANMSHELRTPLNAVIGFSEALLERMFGDLNDKQAEYVGDIHASGKHLLALINDILDLSKIEAGRMELDLGEFDVRATLENALTLVKERAQRQGIRLSLEVDPAVGLFTADERKLKQILLNLLSNAVKFTPAGGTVTVKAALVDEALQISVSDTGVGIAPEDQEAVFEEFRQVGRDYTRKAEGTGLGLALTRRFVELHGGRIGLASVPGEGSTFTFHLPVRHG